MCDGDPDTVGTPFTEEGKYELAERGDEDTRYLRGKPQACMHLHMKYGKNLEKTGKNMFINLGKNRGKRDNLRKRERLESQKAKFYQFHENITMSLFYCQI